ncbi:hypothetical protein BKA81DRAFT_421747 [Phyllosticta paracitricarpa]|uniref:Uncharacterized protein n=1 Tax=Phyllosticta paracitricarpa TaxID=2016321 RepID=A0ABR1NCQ2_9PEZI
MSFSSILTNTSYQNTFLRPLQPNWQTKNISADKVIPKFDYSMRDKNVDNMVTVCGVTVEYVDVQVECSRLTTAGELDCVSKALRRTHDPPATPFITATTFFPWHRVGDMPSYKDIPLSVFRSRLALLLDTYWHMSLNTSIYLGTDVVTPSAENNTESWYLGELRDWASTTGSWTTPAAPTYVISPGWMALYAVATVVLTLCALATIVLQSQIRASDILGSMSTLTRDSPYVAVPPAGSGIEGTERARWLKNMWVRIQDVRPG